MTLLVAIHGILTAQTSASWPDALDAFMARRDPQIRVLKKEYRAGPFPRLNNWIKDPLLARGLVNEILEFVRPHPGPLPQEREQPGTPRVWFVSHSNGAVIALQTLRKLAAARLPVAGAIFAGAAIEADVHKSGLFALPSGKFIAWSCRGDRVTDTQPEPGESRLRRVRDWLYGRLAWPYGSLGHTGWLSVGHPFESERFLTRWAPSSWGHSGWWTPERRKDTFEQIRQTITKG